MHIATSDGRFCGAKQSWCEIVGRSADQFFDLLNGYDFGYKDYSNIFDLSVVKAQLSAVYSNPSSVNTKASCGIKLFREGLNIEALKQIISGTKVDSSVVDNAKDILSKELKHGI